MTTDVLNPYSVMQHHQAISTGSTSIFDKLTPFFGQVDPKKIEQNAYDRMPYATHNLPDVYKGKNLHLRDTMMNFIFDDNDFYTTVALPWAMTNEMHLSLSEWQFNTVLADRVPHQGISRLVTTSSRESHMSSVRRGLAFIIEADFYNTPEGISRYWSNVVGISGCVQETQNHDTIMSLLTCKDAKQSWNEKFGKLGISFDRIMDEEIANYGCICEDENRLDILYEKYKQLARANGVKFDMIIMSPGSRIYMTMVPPTMTKEANALRPNYLGMNSNGEYVKKVGPEALTKFRGESWVYETRDFDVYRDAPAIQLLDRRVQIGERYEMFARDFRNGSVAGYKSRWRDVYLYSENTDDMSKITFKQALGHAKIWGNRDDYEPKLYELLKIVKKNRSDYSFKTLHTSGEKSSFGGDDDDDEDDDDVVTKENKMNTKPMFFLITEDNNQDLMLANLFGQWGTHAATNNDFMQVGQTIVQYMFKEHEIPGAMRVWNDMMLLISEIEAQPYNREYFIALNKANSRNNARNGKFIGTRTPEDLVRTWKQQSIVEWKGNSYGSLIIPEKNDRLRDVIFPAGFANAPGFLTLAQEAESKSSGWYSVGKRAFDAIGLLSHMLNKGKTLFPESEVLKEEARSPWFHRPDALTTFFENVVAVPRPPVWLAYLPSMDEDEEDAPSLPEPSTTSSLSDKDMELAYKANTFLKRTSLTDGGTVDVSAGGITYKVPMGVLRSKDSMPRRMRLMTLLGDVSYAALNSLEAKINATPSDKSKPDTDPSIRFRQLIDVLLMLPRYINLYAESAKIDKNTEKMDNLKILRNLIILLDKYDKKKIFDLVVKTVESVKELEKPKAKLGSSPLVALIKTAHANASEETKPYFASGKDSTPFFPSSLQEFLDDYAETGEPFLDTVGAAKSLDTLFELTERMVDMFRRYYVDTTPSIEDGASLSLDDISALLRGGFTVRRDSTVTAEQINEVKAAVGAALTDFSDKYAKSGGSSATDDVANFLTESIKKFKSKKATDLKKKKRTTSVTLDDDASIINASYHRCPLTMSLTLLETSAREDFPLILPSDAATGHASYYINDDKDVIPDEFFDNTAYAHIELAQRSNTLQDTTFIGRNVPKRGNLVEDYSSVSIGSGYGAPSSSSGRSGRASSSSLKRKGNPMRAFRSILDEEVADYMSADDVDEDNYRRSESRYGGGDDEDMDSDEGGSGLASAGGNYYSNKKIKSRASAYGNIGATSTETGFGESFRDPKKGWNRETLRGKSRDPSVDKSRPYITPYTEDQADAYKRMYNGAFVNRWKAANEISDKLVRAATKVFLASPCNNGKQLTRMIDNDIHVPINIILWRIFIEHVMSSFILMKAGFSTGANVYGNSNFVVGNDVIQKLIYGNFTFYSKAWVYKEKNVTVLEYVRPIRYIGGNNTRFILYPKHIKNYTGNEKDRRSIIVTAVPITEDSLPRMISFTGLVPLSDDNANIDSKANATYSTCEYYDKICYHVSREIGQRKYGKESYFDKASAFNSLAFQGLQFNWNESTGQFNRVIECRGHRKRNGSGRGTASVWNGSTKFFKEQNFSQYSLA